MDNIKIVRDFINSIAVEITDRLVIPLIETRIDITNDDICVEIETKEYILRFNGYILNDIIHINGYKDLMIWDWDLIKDFSLKIEAAYKDIMVLIKAD